MFIQRGFNTSLIQNKDVAEEDVFWVTMKNYKTHLASEFEQMRGAFFGGSYEFYELFC